MKKKKIKGSNKFNLTLAVVAVFLILTIIFILANFLFLEFNYKSRFMPNVKIAGVSVGGKTMDQAEEALISSIQKWYETPLILKTEEKNWTVDKKDLKVSFDINKTLNEAYNYTREGNYFNQVLEKTSSFFVTKEYNLYFSENNLNQNLLKVVKEANVEGSNVGVVIKDGEITESSEQIGKEVKFYSLKESAKDITSSLSTEELEIPFIKIFPTDNDNQLEALKSEINSFLDKDIVLEYESMRWTLRKNHIGGWLTVENKKDSAAHLDINKYDFKNYFNKDLKAFGVASFVDGKPQLSLKESEVEKYLDKIGKEINISSKNAKLGMQNNQLVLLEPDKMGRELQKEVAISDLLYALRNNQSKVSLPVKITQAEVRSDNLAELGIVELISQGKSDFSGSSSSRITNVTIGASKFNGHLIKPGEEFSFVDILGPVDAAAGFLPEVVIKPGKLVKEYGGGLCQVATTAFRAALYAGLPVTERKNHSFVVSMYFWPFSGPGTDATIYGPHPDLRFKNDTGKYILIQTYIDGKKLFFDFYGTKGSRNVTLEGPFTTSTNGGNRTTVLYRNVFNGTSLERKDTFTSFYKPASSFQRVN